MGTENGLKTKMKINFMDLLRPEFLNPYYSLIGIQEAFGVYQWMVRETEGVRGAYEALSGQPTCSGASEVKPLTNNWKKELHERFLVALLSAYCQLPFKEWKKENRVDVNESRVIHFPHYSLEKPLFIPRSKTDLIMTTFFAVSGKTTKKSYNDVHKDATSVHSIELVVTPEGYRSDLIYGYPKDKYSSWRESFRSEEKEPFLDFLKRAEAHYKRALV